MRAPAVLVAAILLSLVVLALPAASAGCVRQASAAVCADRDLADGRSWARAEVGHLETRWSADYGSSLFGNYVYVIGTAGFGRYAAVHGGVGLVDSAYDGVYENACVCGALQSVVYVPFGVGLEDSDGDGLPDHPYVEPSL